MRTGEGKTLTCVLPAYLNALEGKGVHVVTVNDYLAKRDAEWMGRVHRFLGLKVGVILSNMTPALLEGHFLLTSGKHSKEYVQCAKILRYPDKAAQVLQPVAEQLKDLKPDLKVVFLQPSR